ncbi:Y-family DNA polymerase [Shewanella sp. MF05960]|uniref:Y-family DNA polymerase n=1 Tax=Shewanella sp. MF05960 TaxID=3434874 RepID=UPI003D79208A
MFALVDATSYYCSAEQVFRPEWRHRPVIVLSNNDGCVVAANRLAIELGIPKFQPYFKIANLCRQHQVVVLSSNYELYADLSAKMMQVIGRFAPEQHIYSIDESFLSFKHCQQAIPCLATHARRIRQTVWQYTRLPVCVGIGSTLTLAKVANKAAKLTPASKGVCVIDNEAIRQATLASLSVSDVWGIGRKTAAKLTVMNIHTAWELANTSPTMMRKQFSIEIERTIRELNGVACKQWDEARADKQQIFSTRSVGKRITDIDSLHQALCMHIAIAAAKARKQQSLCKVMMLFAHNSPHDSYPQSFKVNVNFTCATHCSAEMTHAASSVIHRLYRPGVHYYKVGVGLLDLVNSQHQQLDLFNASKAKPQLMQVLDNINHRYGSDTLFLGAQGAQQKWAMHREFLTPQYTTDWRHIPIIHC